MEITLDPASTAAGAAQGLLRHTESDTLGLADAHGMDSDQALQITRDVMGATAEVAFAALLNEPSQARCGSFKEADHIDRRGRHWQVRSTNRGDGDLIVRKDENPDHFYALMIPLDADQQQWRCAGWITGHGGAGGGTVEQPRVP
jgi:hypothetical protein